MELRQFRIFLDFAFVIFSDPQVEYHGSVVSTLTGKGNVVKRFDERETLFSRLGLVKGTVGYDEYYDASPHHQKEDDRLRDLEKILGDNFIGPAQYGSVSDDVLVRSVLPDSVKRVACSLNIEVRKLMPSSRKVEIASTEMCEIIKELTLSYGADLVGIAKLEDHHHYTHRGEDSSLGGSYGDGISCSYNYAIVIATKIRKDFVNRAPKREVLSGAMVAYGRSSIVTAHLAEYIQSLGHEALTDNFIEYSSPMVPLAAAAGLGQIGRCNMIVNQVFGNRLKIAAVLTNLPLIPDEPADFGLVQFCNSCQKCATNCPVKAISFDEPQIFNDILQWPHLEEKCMEMWFKSGTDCGICLSSCPFSQGVSSDLVSHMKGDVQVIDQILKIDDEKHGRRVFHKEGWPVNV